MALLAVYPEGSQAEDPGPDPQGESDWPEHPPEVLARHSSFISYPGTLSHWEEY